MKWIQLGQRIANVVSNKYFTTTHTRRQECYNVPTAKQQWNTFAVLRITEQGWIPQSSALIDKSMRSVLGDEGPIRGQ